MAGTYLPAMIILFLNKFKTASYLTPLSLRATSPIFCVTKHPVILRDTAGRSECFAMPQGIGGVVKGIFSFLV